MLSMPRRNTKTSIHLPCSCLFNFSFCSSAFFLGWTCEIQVLSFNISLHSLGFVSFGFCSLVIWFELLYCFGLSQSGFGHSIWAFMAQVLYSGALAVLIGEGAFALKFAVLVGEYLNKSKLCKTVVWALKILCSVWWQLTSTLFSCHVLCLDQDL